MTSKTTAEWIETIIDPSIKEAEQDDSPKALWLAALLAPSLRPNGNGRYETAMGEKTLVGVYKLICDEVNKQKGE